jgi:hypothetical protein
MRHELFAAAIRFRIMPPSEFPLTSDDRPYTRNVERLLRAKSRLARHFLKLASSSGL